MAPPRRPTLNNSDAPELELGAHGSRESRGQHGTLKLRHQRNTSSSHACLTAAAADLAFISPAPLSPWQRRASLAARAAPYVSPPPPPPGEESTQDEAWPSLAAPAPRAPAPPAPPHAHASEDAPEGEFSEVMSCVSTVVSEGGGDGEIFAWELLSNEADADEPPADTSLDDEVDDEDSSWALVAGGGSAPLPPPLSSEASSSPVAVPGAAPAAHTKRALSYKDVAVIGLLSASPQMSPPRAKLRPSPLRAVASKVAGGDDDDDADSLAPVGDAEGRYAQRTRRSRQALESRARRLAKRQSADAAAGPAGGAS